MAETEKRELNNGEEVEEYTQEPGVLLRLHKTKEKGEESKGKKVRGRKQREESRGRK